MTSFEFANKIISMPSHKQNEFFEKLKSELSKEDWETTVKFIALLSMFMDVGNYRAVESAIREQLSEEFYGHTEEKVNNREDNVLASMYQNSIL